MLHQPLIGGVLQGPATDLGIEAAHMLRLRDRLYKLMADYTGKAPETIHRDFDRNKWLFAEEAVEYGCRRPRPQSRPRRHRPCQRRCRQTQSRVRWIKEFRYPKSEI